MSEWRLIETAPKDGTEVDLWMVNDDGNAWRVTNADWEDGYEIDMVGRKIKREGWVAPNQNYEDPGWCETKGSRATHWMPLPAPPNPGA